MPYKKEVYYITWVFHTANLLWITGALHMKNALLITEQIEVNG